MAALGMSGNHSSKDRVQSFWLLDGHVVSTLGDDIQATVLRQLIATVIDQNPLAHCLRPIDMIFHGRSCSVRQA